MKRENHKIFTIGRACQPRPSALLGLCNAIAAIQKTEFRRDVLEHLPETFVVALLVFGLLLIEVDPVLRDSVWNSTVRLFGGGQ